MREVRLGENPKRATGRAGYFPFGATVSVAPFAADDSGGFFRVKKSTAPATTKKRRIAITIEMFTWVVRFFTSTGGVGSSLSMPMVAWNHIEKRGSADGDQTGLCPMRAAAFLPMA